MINEDSKEYQAQDPDPDKVPEATDMFAVLEDRLGKFENVSSFEGYGSDNDMMNRILLVISPLDANLFDIVYAGKLSVGIENKVGDFNMFYKLISGSVSNYRIKYHPDIEVLLDIEKKNEITDKSPYIITPEMLFNGNVYMAYLDSSLASRTRYKLEKDLQITYSLDRSWIVQ